MNMKRVIGAAFLIILGILLLVELIFNINMHVFGTMFALGMVFLGVYLLTGGTRRKYAQRTNQAQTGYSSEQSWFSGGYYEINGGGASAHESFFSSAQVRIGHDAPPNIEVSAVFSSMTLYAPAGRRVNLVMDSAFGSIYPPEGSSISFGSSSAMFGEGDILNLHVSCVFGSVSVEMYEQ